MEQASLQRHKHQVFVSCTFYDKMCSVSRADLNLGTVDTETRLKRRVYLCTVKKCWCYGTNLYCVIPILREAISTEQTHTQRCRDAVFRALANENWVDNWMDAGTELKTLTVLALINGQSNSMVIGDGQTECMVIVTARVMVRVPARVMVRSDCLPCMTLTFPLDHLRSGWPPAKVKLTSSDPDFLSLYSKVQVTSSSFHPSFLREREISLGDREKGMTGEQMDESTTLWWDKKLTTLKSRLCQFQPYVFIWNLSERLGTNRQLTLV